MLRGELTRPETDLLQQLNRREREDCVRRCQVCHRACLDLAGALDGVYGGDAGMLVELLLDTADITAMLATTLGHTHARLNQPLAALCREICERCERECARRMEEGEAEPCIRACAQCAVGCRGLIEERSIQ